MLDKAAGPLEAALDAPFTLHSDKAGDVDEGYLIIRYAIA